MNVKKGRTDLLTFGGEGNLQTNSDSQKPPLEIHDLPLEILHMILKNLSVQDKKRARLVCRKWNEELCQILKNEVFLKLTGGSEWLKDKHSIEDMESLLVRRVPDFPTLIQKIRIYINHKTKFEDLNAFFDRHPWLCPCIKQLACQTRHRATGTMCWPPDLSDIVPLLKKFAPHLTHLLFHRDCQLTEELLSSISQEQIVFPELRYLHITFGLQWFQGQRGSHTERVNIMFSGVESLMKTSPKLFQADVAYNLMNPVSSYQKEKFLSHGPQLQHLELRDFGNSFSADILSSSPVPPLKSLILHGKLAECQFSPMLAGLSNSLEFLRINCDCTTNFPVLHKLKYLHLDCNFDLSKNNWIHEQLPVLKELKAHTLDLRSAPEVKDIRAHQSLLKIRVKRVTFDKGEMESEVKSIRAIRASFPNLRTWTIEDADFLQLALSPANQSLPDSEQLVIDDLICFNNGGDSRFAEYISRIQTNSLATPNHQNSPGQKRLHVIKGIKRVKLIGYRTQWKGEQLLPMCPDLEIMHLGYDYCRNKEHAQAHLLRSLGCDYVAFDVDSICF